MYSQEQARRMKAVPSYPSPAWILQTCGDCGLPFRGPIVTNGKTLTACIDCVEGEKSADLRIAAHALFQALSPVR